MSFFTLYSAIVLGGVTVRAVSLVGLLILNELSRRVKIRLMEKYREKYMEMVRKGSERMTKYAQMES